MKNAMTLVRKYGAKLAFVAAPVAVLSNSAHAAVDPISTLLATVDLTTISVSVAAIAVLLVGIKLTFKAPDVAARVIRKV